MDLLFVTGCMRSGTTMMSRWIEGASPVFATRESAILLVNHWLLSAARFQSRVGDFKPIYLEAFDQVTHRLYREIGWDGRSIVADKHPYALSDFPLFLEHLEEMFGEPRPSNSMVVVYLIRNPFDVIASMRARIWGDVRGSVLNPGRIYSYWDDRDINNFLSPFSFRLDPRENLVGDEFAERGTMGRWSIEKCCQHWKNALRVLDSPRLDRFVIVDYDRLSDPAYASRVRTAIEERRGIRFASDLTFEVPAGRSPLPPEAEASVRDLLGESAFEDYRTLKRMAEDPGYVLSPRTTTPSSAA